MLEKLFDRSFIFLLIIMFFIYSAIYNIGYFGTLGDSLWYFLYVPITAYDIVKTGLVMIIPLILILMIFKPILINPAFNGIFPSANILLIMTILVLVSNLFYFVILSDSQNRSLSLIVEVMFYIFSSVCFISIVYYFFTNASPQSLMVIFFLSLIPITFCIGVVDAKISIISTRTETKSRILLQNDTIISANVLRSVDKGIFVIINNTASIDFITWDQIKRVKFKKVNAF